MILPFGVHSSKGSVSRSTKEASDGLSPKATRRLSHDGTRLRTARYETGHASQSFYPEPWPSRGRVAAFQIIEAAADRYSVQRGDGAEGRVRPVRLDLPRRRLGAME